MFLCPSFCVKLLLTTKVRLLGCWLGWGGRRRRSWWVGFLLGLLRETAVAAGTERISTHNLTRLFHAQSNHHAEKMHLSAGR